jgi:bifunctional non-homologous end joining protein LigD
MVFAPMRLTSLREPFDHPDFVFELKWDGWRCVAQVGDNVVLFSRHANVYRRFDELKTDLKAAVRGPCVLDGEIVCLDDHGRPQFYDLLRRRGNPVFVAFDILEVHGRDLRGLTLLERKRLLHQTVTACGRVLCPEHIETHGIALYQQVCQLDLEGIVAKWKHGRYEWEGRPSQPDIARVSPWIKIRNPHYTQREGRAELFERRTK